MKTDFEAVATRELRAQAAVWVTDLHGPERSEALEAALRRWLAEDPRHAKAFELATDAWQRSGNLQLPLGADATQRMRGPRLNLAPLTLAGALSLALVLAAGFYWLKDPTLTTGYGEQKIVDLSDGTEVTLNANSRLTVSYSTHLREVTLLRGEALLNVTKHQDRPFVVIAGSRKVIALGTQFDVCQAESGSTSYAVTLIEGRIAVQPLTAPNLWPASSSTAVILAPGERLRFAANAPDMRDTPPLERVTAWQHGQLIFEDTSLREAAQEFNRYGKRRIRIDPSVADTLRVGGVFRIGDPESFAHAMESAHHLRIIESQDEIKLTRP
jgi:transmembrane sensor